MKNKANLTMLCAAICLLTTPLQAQTNAEKVSDYFNQRIYGSDYVTVKYTYLGVAYSAVGSRADKKNNRILATVKTKEDCMGLGKFQKYGFIDSTGKWVINPIYDLAERFFDGYAVVSQCGPDGLTSWHIQINGMPLYYEKYTDVYSFYNGYAKVDKDGEYHMCHINKKGEPLYTQTYPWIENFNSKGKAIVIRDIDLKNDKCIWVVIDTHGKELYTKKGTYDVGNPPKELRSYLGLASISRINDSTSLLKSLVDKGNERIEKYNKLVTEQNNLVTQWLRDTTTAGNLLRRPKSKNTSTELDQAASLLNEMDSLQTRMEFTKKEITRISSEIREIKNKIKRLTIFLEENS